MGIDTIAHRSALNAGGRTICVPGGGFKRPFPISNVELFSRLGRDDGFRDSCMISEYSPSESASRHHFPERNRIVAALADAVLVIQAGFGSGAMITADLALEMCIPVFAVPADIHYSSSAATNDLLGRGGRPMCRPGDLETVVNLAGSGLSGFNRKPVRRTSGLGSPWISRGASGRSTRHADGSDAQVILEAVRSILSETGRAVDQDSICRQTGLDVARVQAGLRANWAAAFSAFPGRCSCPARGVEAFAWKPATGRQPGCNHQGVVNPSILNHLIHLVHVGHKGVQILAVIEVPRSRLHAAGRKEYMQAVANQRRVWPERAQAHKRARPETGFLFQFTNDGRRRVFPGFNHAARKFPRYFPRSGPELPHQDDLPRGGDRNHGCPVTADLHAETVFRPRGFILVSRRTS